MNSDFIDFLGALLTADARFLVVGAHALAIHGVPRATGDIDVWIERSPDNAARVWRALEEFGAPTVAPGVRREDLEAPDMVIQIGLPPRRIDVLTGVSGLEFADAWRDRIVHRIEHFDVPFLGRDALIRNKRASGRFKDLGDLEALGEDPVA
ncbi:MAG TPA: hypothetical protein VFK39_09940 [Gemmatimonadaceae bacterium]|nr:hypothetical protein [Gemmatimonadaceae bacterium]